MDLETEMSVGDVLVGLVYALAMLAAGYLFARRSPDRNALMGALLVKLFSCFAMCAMAIPVFQGGDMVGYHYHGVLYAQALEEDLRLGTSTYLEKTPFFILQHSNTERARSFSGLVHFLTFHSFVASSMVFSVI